MKTKINWQKFQTFSQKTLTSEYFDNDNKLTLKSFFAFCSFFSGFQNIPELKRAKTFSALSFDRINFFNMANLFSLSRKAFVMCYCFRAPIKTFFFGTCQMTVKSCVLRLFPVPQTGRSHIIITNLVFFHRFMARAWSINRWKKTRSVIYSTDRKLG